MSLQHSHTTTPFSRKTFPITIICDALNSPANIGAIFRIVEAFGVSEIVFCNSEINLNSSRLKRTSRDAHTKTPYRIEEDILAEIEKLKTSGYQIIGLEITKNSISIEKVTVLKNKGIALIIGSEQQGISEAVLQKLTQIVHIDMYGENSSMNVVQATGIALYAITSKLV